MGKVKHTEYYDLLEIQPDATPEEIKKAYRKRALKLHPDRGGDPEEFKKMKAAYDVLSDPSKKQLYDKYGPQVIKMMDGEAPGTSEMSLFLSQLRKRDRLMLVLIISIVSLFLLLFPILLSYKWDELGHNRDPWSWAVSFIPLWILEGFIIFGFVSQVRQQPMDFSNPDIDEEARTAWKKTEKTLNVLRIAFGYYMGLMILFQIFLVIRLDGVVDWSWSVVMIPWNILQASSIVTQCHSYAHTFTKEHSPPDEESDHAEINEFNSATCTSPSYWGQALLSAKWSIALFITSIIAGIAADKNTGTSTFSFYYAAIPLFIIMAAYLFLQLMLWIKSPAKDNATPEAEGEKPGDPSLFSILLSFICTYGLLLVIICCAASKLTYINSVSAFAIFSPVFFVVGCVCCLCSVFALTISAEDIEEAENQAAAANGGRGADTNTATENYGTMGGNDETAHLNDVHVVAQT